MRRWSAEAWRQCLPQVQQARRLPKMQVRICENGQEMAGNDRKEHGQDSLTDHSIVLCGFLFYKRRLDALEPDGCSPHYS